MSVSHVVIRDARPADRDAVRDLTLAAYAEYAAIMTPTAWAGLERAVHSALDSEARVHRVVAEHDGRMVGSVSLYPPSADAYGGVGHRVAWPELRLLAVAAESRGLGVGQLLVEECIQRARTDGASAIGLHTSASMRNAMRLYERAGFERVPEFDFQPAGAELVEAYVLHLDAAVNGTVPKS